MPWDTLVRRFDGFLLKAVDVATGRVAWAEHGFGGGASTCARDCPVLRGRCWTPPALAGGRLYLRSASELVALEPRS